MVSKNFLTKSTNIRATVLLTTIWAASAIGIAKDEYQKKTPEIRELGAYSDTKPTNEATNSTLQISERLFGFDLGTVLKTVQNIVKETLFDWVNCNVLVVDWRERAVMPYYAKAASSAPLVGVLLSLMLQKIIETSNCSLHPDNVHLIGFSLGAHAAGVCGRHFYNTTGFLLGRITGLDPAGPLFEESNVSLSADDAAFVDVIHTNAGNISQKMFGLNKSIGHVDFYPNGGSHQPGCEYNTDSDDLGCSHKRAQALFTESLYRNCSFTSYFCEGGWTQFLNGSCTSNASLIGEMGYYSINKTGRDNQYLNTSSAPPFCIPQPATENPQISTVESQQVPQE